MKRRVFDTKKLRKEFKALEDALGVKLSEDKRFAQLAKLNDATTADLWEERNSKAARRVPRDLWPVVHRKLTMLDSAQRLDDLNAVPGNRLEALAGDRKGQHSIRVNQQYRITFRWEKHDAHDVCCADYH